MAAQARALAATEVELEADDRSPFRRLAAEHVRHIQRKLNEIQTPKGDALHVYGGGTVTASAWVPIATKMLSLEIAATPLRDDYRAVDFVWQTKHGFLISEIKIGSHEAEEVGLVEQTQLPESALVAKEVRDLSGLGAQKLGAIFPVERESYQRWISGTIVPSAGNLERLLALRHFLRELANRVEAPKSWLLAPLAEGVSSGTRYEALKAGNLTALWDSIADLPSKTKQYTREMPDGTVLTVKEGSLRGREIRTTPDELEGYEEWLSEDE